MRLKASFRARPTSPLVSFRNADINRGKNNALRAEKPMMTVRAFFQWSAAKRCSSDSRLCEGDARRSEQVRAFAQRRSVLRRSCYQLGPEGARPKRTLLRASPSPRRESEESLLSGTQERAENKGRSPRTITECFLCFFLNQVTPHLPFNHLLFTIYYATLQSQFHTLDGALLLLRGGNG